MLEVLVLRVNEARSDFAGFVRGAGSFVCGKYTLSFPHGVMSTVEILEGAVVPVVLGVPVVGW